ncbi:MAG: META domain-containing protein [Pseudomonadota bacterium]
MRFIIALLFTAAVASADGAPQWQLRSLDGKPFTARAVMQIGPDGSLSGRAPCNAFSGKVAAGSGAFAVGPLRATRMACPDLRAESQFFKALGQMKTMRQRPDQLVLTGPGGRKMVFTPAD